MNNRIIMWRVLLLSLLLLFFGGRTTLNAQAISTINGYQNKSNLNFTPSPNMTNANQAIMTKPADGVQCNQGYQDPLRGLDNMLDDIPVANGDIGVYTPVDPNEIVGTTGFDLPSADSLMQWVSATQRLPYTIYFENDPEFATAAAQKVEIRHQFHNKANIASFGIGSFGFGEHVFSVEGTPSNYQQRLDLTEALGIYVDVVAGVDIVAGEAFWIFQSIDPETGLPPLGAEQGFLPINDENHSGEGFVTFTIKPKSTACTTGDQLTAMASIVFDINEAIPTNVWYNTIDALPPTTTMTGTEREGDELLLQFTGNDDENGSGIKQYKLYVSDNYTAYQLYENYPVGEEATFFTEYGHCYRFFCLGEDNVGNVEAMKETADFEYGNYNLNLLVSASPELGGSVTGGGTFQFNTNVTVTATAAANYEFSHWTSQGVTVSTDPVYTFELRDNTELVANFVPVEPGQDVDQVLAFTEGWNWFSTFVECSDDLLTDLQEGIADSTTTAMLKGVNHSTMLQHGNWSSSELSLINESMYMANVGNSLTVTLSAPLAHPAEHPVTIIPGWNWIGFVSASEMTIEEALSSIAPHNNDLIKSMKGVSSYSNGAWMGGLETMDPGVGYMYFNRGDTLTLTYPTAGRAVVCHQPIERYWTTDAHQHATNLVVMATLDADQIAMEEGNYEIGAFVDGACRGSARLQQTEGGYVAFLVIHGEAGETIQFQLYDVVKAMEMGKAEEQIVYLPNAIVGAVAEPMVLHLRGTQGVDEDTEQLSLFPNPTKDKVMIQGQAMDRVSVFNAFGQCLFSKECGHANSVELSLGDLSAGVYMLSVRLTDGRRTNKRIVKE